MTGLVGYMLLFLVVAILFIFVHLMMGKMIRPAKPDPDKLTIYECGEPTIGSAWIQFDLRFYVVALLFVIFDVEVAFFFPWAVVFGHANTLATEGLVTQQDPPEKEDSRRVQLAKRELLNMKADERPTPARAEEIKTAAGALGRLAFVDILVFFGVLLVGFAYLWRRGDLDWVRSTAAERAPPPAEWPAAPPAPAPEALVTAGQGAAPVPSGELTH